MQLTILYFAKLREAVQCAEETLTLADKNELTVAELITHLQARDETWHAALSESIKCAVNQEFAEPSAALHNGDEVALFPPVTGG